MGLWGLARVILAAGAVGQEVASKKRRVVPRGGADRLERWLWGPKSAVLIVLAAVVLIGGGRKLLQARRARAALGRLEGPEVTPEAIEAAGEHGRAGLPDLFRLLGEGGKEP